MRSFGDSRNANETENIKKTELNPEEPTWRIFPALPKSLQQLPFILMAKALFNWMACHENFQHLQAELFILLLWALLFGIIFYEIGFIEHKILDKANSSGLTLFILLVPIFMNLSKATPKMVASMILPMMIAFIIALLGMIIVSLLLSKILKYSWGDQYGNQCFLFVRVPGYIYYKSGSC